MMTIDVRQICFLKYIAIRFTHRQRCVLTWMKEETAWPNSQFSFSQLWFSMPVHYIFNYTVLSFPQDLNSLLWYHLLCAKNSLKNLVVTFSYNAQTSQNYVHIKALYMKINNKFIIFDNMLIWLSHAHYITHHTNLWKIMICLHSSQQPLLPSYPKPQHNPENSIMSFFLNEFFPPSKVH